MARFRTRWQAAIGARNGNHCHNDRPRYVRAEIARGCREANRDAAEVTLVAVSKTLGLRPSSR